MDKHKITLMLSHEQRETLLNFMKFNNWAVEVLENSFRGKYIINPLDITNNILAVFEII